jgi:hypothetical protein
MDEEKVEKIPCLGEEEEEDDDEVQDPWANFKCDLVVSLKSTPCVHPKSLILPSLPNLEGTTLIVQGSQEDELDLGDI